MIIVYKKSCIRIVSSMHMFSVVVCTVRTYHVESASYDTIYLKYFMVFISGYSSLECFPIWQLVVVIYNWSYNSNSESAFTYSWWTLPIVIIAGYWSAPASPHRVTLSIHNMYFNLLRLGIFLKVTSNWHALFLFGPCSKLTVIASIGINNDIRLRLNSTF